MRIPVHSTMHLEGRGEVEERRGVQGARGTPPAAASNPVAFAGSRFDSVVTASNPAAQRFKSRPWRVTRA